MTGISLERWLSMENFKGEVWKDVDGFGGVYEISNYGRVKSSNYGGLIRKPRFQRNGYETVRLWKNGKAKFYLIHRLVFSHFVEKLNDNLVIDHIDGNKVNNHFTNLQQITNRENTNKSVSNKLLKGVKRINKGNCYTSALNIGYKRYYLGHFKTIEDANAAYNCARLNYENNGILPSIEHRKINRVIDGCKVCNQCGEFKPISEFAVCSGKLRSKCKKCESINRKKELAIKRGGKPLNMHRKTWEKLKKNGYEPQN